MTSARFPQPRAFPGGGARRTARAGARPRVTPDAGAAWRGLIEAALGLRAVHGVGGVTALAEAAQACARVGFPVDGADAAAGAGALLDVASAYPASGEDARGHNLVLLEAAAAYCAARLEQADLARARFFRRQSGDD